MFENKLVAVMNKSFETGIIMNALGHMCVGFGASIGKPDLRLADYADGNGNSHPHISEMPFIILRATGGKIRTLREKAVEENIAHVDFTDTMACRIVPRSA